MLPRPAKTDWNPSLTKLCKAPSISSDLQVYQVGNKLLELDVLQGRDMTSEAAMTKLMWGLGQNMDQTQICRLFETNLAGEITI